LIAYLRMVAAECKQCKEALSYPGLELALLLPNGNEESVRVGRCGKCGKVYLDGFEEEFMGGCQTWLHGPFSDEEGPKIPEAIGKCPQPMNKHCACPSHKYVFDLVCGGKTGSA